MGVCVYMYINLFDILDKPTVEVKVNFGKRRTESIGSNGSAKSGFIIKCIIDSIPIANNSDINISIAGS